MPRLPRKFQDNGVYHLITRGNNRKAIFEISHGYKRFKEIVFLSKLKFRWKIYHYCLMPNHIHILGRVENSKEMPLLMQYILQMYSRWYRSKTGYIGYLWQGRYKSPLIEDESYLLECGRYIERNPVRAGLSTMMEDYPWSSYRYYALGHKDEIVSPSPTYQNFGIDASERQKHYRDFACLKTPYEEILDRALVSKFF